MRIRISASQVKTATSKVFWAPVQTFANALRKVARLHWRFPANLSFIKERFNL